MPVVVVTGTSTDVGKTVASAAFAAVAAKAGQNMLICKPVQTGLQDGEPGDADDAARLSGAAAVEFVRYPDPLSPVVAARRCGRRLWSCQELADKVEQLARSRFVVVEGAGGVLVRIGSQDTTVLDLAALLQAPMIVVTSAELGALNHAELTVNAIRAAGVRVAGLVIGSWPHEPQLAHVTNLDAFFEHTGAKTLGKIPAQAGALRPDVFQSQAPGWFLGSGLRELWQTGSAEEQKNLGGLKERTR